MSEPKTFQIACHGWAHAAWTPEFYPDDLPEDWRLDYYANQLSAVLLPGEPWQPDWGDNIGDWPDRAALPRRLRLFARGPVGAGPWDDLRELALPWLRAWGDRFAGWLLPPDSLAATHLSAQLWCELCPDTVLAGAARRLPRFALRLPESGELTLRQWRTLFEAVDAASPEARECLVLVEGEPPDIDLAIQLQQLLEWMGLVYYDQPPGA